MSMVPSAPTVTLLHPPVSTHPRKKRKFLWKKDSVDEILDWMSLHCLQAIRSVTKEIAEAIKETFFQDEDQVTVVVIQTKFQNLRKQYKAAGEILHGIRSVPEELNLSIQEAALKECPYYYKMFELNQKYESQLKAQDAHLYQSSHLHINGPDDSNPHSGPYQVPPPPPPPQLHQAPHQPPPRPNHHSTPNIGNNEMPPLPPRPHYGAPPLPPPPSIPYNTHNPSIPPSATALLNAAQSILPSAASAAKQQQQQQQQQQQSGSYLPPISSNLSKKRSFDDFAQHNSTSSQPLTPPYNRGNNNTVLPPVQSFDNRRRSLSTPWAKIEPKSESSSKPTIASLTNPSSTPTSPVGIAAQAKPIPKSLSSSGSHHRPYRSSRPSSPVSSSSSMTASTSMNTSSTFNSGYTMNSSVIGVVSDPPLSSIRSTPLKSNPHNVPASVAPSQERHHDSRHPYPPPYSSHYNHHYSSSYPPPPSYSHASHSYYTNGPAPLAPAPPHHTLSVLPRPSPPPAASAAEINMLWQTIHDLRREVSELRIALDAKSKTENAYPSPASSSSIQPAPSSNPSSGSAAPASPPVDASSTPTVSSPVRSN